MNLLRQARDKQIGRCVPDLFDHKTVLYIGAKLRWNYPFFRGQDGFAAAGCAVDVVELIAANVAKLKAVNANGHRFQNGLRGPGMFRKIIKGDVRHVSKLTRRRYDVVMWWQGPEHVHLHEVEPTLLALWQKTKKILLLGCPCGGITIEHPMARIERFKNSPSAHYSIFNDRYFADRGFTVDVVGECGVRGNNMLAVRRRP